MRIWAATVVDKSAAELGHDREFLLVVLDGALPEDDLDIANLLGRSAGAELLWQPQILLESPDHENSLRPSYILPLHLAAPASAGPHKATAAAGVGNKPPFASKAADLRLDGFCCIGELQALTSATEVGRSMKRVSQAQEAL
jgi:hypothetical protein